MIRSSHIHLSLALTSSLLLIADAARAELPTIGEPVPVYTVETDGRVQNFESLHREQTGSTSQIRTILDLEARATTVPDAIRIKSQGLTFVRDIHDFEYLTSAPFKSPTHAYKEALGTFIINHLGSYLRSNDDLSLPRFETRVGTVPQTVRVKEIALSVANDLQDFEQITRDPFSTSTDEYKVGRSSFIRRNISSYVRRGDSIETVLTIEGRCRTVEDAFVVKTAGLQAVTSIESYQRLVSSAFSNPYQAYTDRRKMFLARNIAHGVSENSDIGVILSIESECASVEDAIRVKTGGLAAAQDLEEFLQLTRYAFSNPYQAYKEAVSRFIASYGSRYRA